jgi:uncharacterized protein (TIGR02594 family)
MTMPVMMTPADFTNFPWMRVALQEVGQHELTGPAHNHRILLYHTATGHAQSDEVPWCSSFANWCMKQAGIHGSGQPNARSWLAWGTGLSVTDPSYGCIVVFSRPPNAWTGHVGFYVGTAAGDICVLGGNQGNAVRLKNYPWSHWLGFRWPTGYPRPR